MHTEHAVTTWLQNARSDVWDIISTALSDRDVTCP
jgi:hypothetical protein